MNHGSNNSIPKRKIAVIIGTRPEAIKLGILIKKLKQHSHSFTTTTILTGQHKEMLHNALKVFNVAYDYDLSIMMPEQTLFDISREILLKIEKIFLLEKPDLVLVQGDTPTAFVACLAAFYLKIPVGHIEAGLRTYKKYAPFPEEMNRQLIDVLSDLYFVPTKQNKKNLLLEGKASKNIWVTGNTGIDAAAFVASRNTEKQKGLLLPESAKEKRLILFTCHRREIWGIPAENIFAGLRRVCDEQNDVFCIFPIHLNPVMRSTAEKVLKNHPRIMITKPQPYTEMIALMQAAYLIVTDSGGIQEEAPFFHKPVAVIRNVTERQEGIKAGTLILAGTKKDAVYKTITTILTDAAMYKKITRARNPYGDGNACDRIIAAITTYFGLQRNEKPHRSI